MLALLQFDAVDLTLAERMMAEDRLPTLAALRAQGSWHALEAVSDLFELAMYPTLYTGEELGLHGLYSAFVWSAEDQGLRFMHGLPKPETAVERIARAGGRSLLLDPYQLWPPARNGGIAISGWQLEQKVNPRWSSPPAAARGLARRFGRAPVLSDSYGERSPSRLLDMRRDLLNAPARAADAATYLLARERFDLAWFNLISAHQAGHNFWATETLEQVYAASDAALARVLAALPPGADVIVFSPLGMGANNSRSDMLPDMLSAVLGATSPASASEGERRGSSVWRLRAAVPATLRAEVARRMPGAAVRQLVQRLYLRNVDWSTTRAFALPGDHFGYLQLNLRGREREGIVDPADANALMEEIATGLETFNDPDGAPAVAKVERTADTISGPGADGLPDLVVRWSERPSKDVTHVSSERHGTIQRRGVGSGWTGNHVQGAWIVLPDTIDRRPQIIDIAATACAHAGADTTGLAGEPLLEPA